MRTFDNRYGNKIIKTVYEHEPTGIRHRQLRLKIEMYSKTFDRWIDYLINKLKLLEKDKDNQQYIHLTEAAKIKLGKNRNTIIPEDNRKKKNNNIKTITTFQNKEKKEARDNAYVILAFVASLGNIRYEKKNMIYTDGKSMPGVGVSDFKKKKERQGIQSTLDRRIFVGYNERFAYLNFTKGEIQQYISELKNNHNEPILKEITISDHKFLSYVYDIDNPHLIILNREGSVIGEDKLRLVINQEEEDRLQFYHDISTTNNNHDNNIKINSKLVFDINNERTRKLLRLDTYYKDNNNFSKSLWKEKRYIIADSLLQEFVIICNQILDHVWWRMDYAYIDTPYIRKKFIRWYERVYGIHRRKAETFLPLDEAKTKLKKLNKKKRKDRHERVKGIIDSIDCSIIKNYSKLESQKFIQIQHKYKIVTMPLLDISYPEFLRELHKIKRKTD